MTSTEPTEVTGTAPPALAVEDAAAAGHVEEKDVVRRFAERGEEALHRLGDLPGGSRAIKALSEIGRRVDELGRKVRGVDDLEARVARLEREVAELVLAAQEPEPPSGSGSDTKSEDP